VESCDWVGYTVEYEWKVVTGCFCLKSGAWYNVPLASFYCSDDSKQLCTLHWITIRVTCIHFTLTAQLPLAFRNPDAGADFEDEFAGDGARFGGTVGEDFVNLGRVGEKGVVALAGSPEAIFQDVL